MLTISEINSFLHSEDKSLLTKMISYKGAIQNKIANLITPDEALSIVLPNSPINNNIINKLIILAAQYYKQEPNKDNLFCLSIVIGTIIKEYDWGNYYLTKEGLAFLVDKISTEK